jgi:hypothetical protein
MTAISELRRTKTQQAMTYTNIGLQERTKLQATCTQLKLACCCPPMGMQYIRGIYVGNVYKCNFYHKSRTCNFLVSLEL